MMTNINIRCSSIIIIKILLILYPFSLPLLSMVIYDDSIQCDEPKKGSQDSTTLLGQTVNSTYTHFFHLTFFSEKIK